MPGYYGKRKANTLSKFATSTAKRRKTVSNATKIKYQAPTARNQRSQIMHNARRVSALSKIVLRQRVWCDWQQQGTTYAAIDTSGSYTTTWGVVPLTNFTGWFSVLRADQNVVESSRTFVKRMSINLRYSLNASSWAQYNVFLVTLRRDAASEDPVATNPVKGPDYIESTEGFNIRLNPAKYKVHYARYLTLTENTLFTAPLATLTAGDPRTTYSKGQVTIQPKMGVRVPAGRTNSWKDIPFTDLPYYQKYFLMVYIVQGQQQGVTTDSGARFDYDMLATTINSD